MKERRRFCLRNFVIKNKGKYLCDFVFKKGCTFISKNKISYFANIITTEKITKEFINLANRHGGKIKCKQLLK